jgi:Flp pilus assembly pilin Flp
MLGFQRMSSRLHARQLGQALVEYAFLFVLVATISIAVVMLAGNQLKATYDELSYQFGHLGTQVIVGNSPQTCHDGTPATLHGHKYWCHP